MSPFVRPQLLAHTYSKDCWFGYQNRYYLFYDIRILHRIEEHCLFEFIRHLKLCTESLLFIV